MAWKIIDKYGSKKVFLSLFILIICINSLLLGVLIRKEKTVIYEGDKLIYQERNNRTSIFKDNDGNILTVKSINVALDDELMITDDLHSSYEIDYKGKQIFYDNSKFMEMETKITLFDGSIYESTPIYVDYYNDQSYELPKDVKLTYDVINIHMNPNGILGNFGDIILGFIFIFIGLVGLIYPKKLWKFEHRLDVKGGEPTDFAIISSQIGGIIFIFMPTVILIFGIFKL
ncbi:MAG: DUF6199 family natural product biosynthesis protein [Peptostreptococcaceae bacterium]